jgi:phage-related protein
MEYEIELYEKVDNEHPRRKRGVLNSTANKVPVLDFIVSLNPKQQAKIYREIELLKKFGNELHFPHVRKMEGEKYNSLWELRIEFASDAFRIFYFMYYQNKSILLHGFQKKIEKTPAKELDIALNRMNDYIARSKK